MLAINRKNNWHDRDSNPKLPAWERYWPNPTAVIYFWIKRVGNFGLKKKPYWMTNFSCILHMLRKITNTTITKGDNIFFTNLGTVYLHLTKGTRWDLNTNMFWIHRDLHHQIKNSIKEKTILEDVLILNT